jgi:hypothetical protein
VLEIVQKVSVEQEIADWLRRSADLSRVASVNEKLFSPRIKDVLAFIPAARYALALVDGGRRLGGINANLGGADSAGETWITFPFGDAGSSEHFIP